MDKAQKLLEKYGWKEGEGLGKGQNGIKEALKPKLKRDANGIGYSHKEFPWWEHAYNNAAKSVTVKSNDAGASFNSQTIEEGKQSKVKKETNRLITYLSFCKGGTLENGITVTEQEGPLEVPEDNAEVNTLSYEVLFKVCEGRTVHKGARHGLKLSGKLSRIEKHDKKLLKRLKKEKKLKL